MNEQQEVGGKISTVNFVGPIVWQYDPQPDITAYEVAMILPFLFNPVIFPSDMERLGVAARHIKRVG